MDPLQALAPSARSVVQVPRTRGTDYLTRYAHDHRIHRLVLRGTMDDDNSWNSIVLSRPEIDLLGNEGYVASVERVVINFESAPDPDFNFQQWMHVETEGLTTGRIIVNDNYFKFDNGSAEGSSASYADWYVRAVHNSLDDVKFLFEPTGPTQEYVIPHDRMQFQFKWRVVHRVLQPPAGPGQLPALATGAQLPNRYAEVTFVFYPNKSRMFV